MPGRGSVHARLRGDGTGGEPLLLLSHLDVVPAPRRSLDPRPVRGRDRRRLRLRPRRGRHEGHGRDGARRGPPAGRARPGRPAWTRPGTRSPASDARRPVHLHRGRGGRRPRRREVDRRPPARWLQAAGGLNECGRRLDDGRGRPPLPDPGRREGLRRLPDLGPRDVGPRLDAARRQRRRARGGHRRATGRARPDPRHAGDGPLHGGRRGRAPGRSRARAPARSLGDDPVRADAALEAICDPAYARTLRALLRDTISPDIITAGIKYNVIPGDATIEVDCRLLPGTTEPEMRAEVAAADRAGPGRGLRDRAHRVRRPGRGAGRGPALRHPRGDDPRPRPRRHPAAGHGPVRDRRQAHGAARRPDLRVLPAPPGPRRALPGAIPRRRRARRRSTPCAGGCPSSTTSSAASAADARGSRLLRGRTRPDCPDDDLLVAASDRRRAGRRSSERSGSCSAGSWCCGRRLERGSSMPSRVPVLQAEERLPQSGRWSIVVPPRRPALFARGADQPAAPVDGMGRERRHAHRDDRPLGGRAAAGRPTGTGRPAPGPRRAAWRGRAGSGGASAGAGPRAPRWRSTRRRRTSPSTSRLVADGDRPIASASSPTVIVLPSARTYSAASWVKPRRSSPSWPANPMTSSRQSARPMATRSLIWRTFGSRLPAARTGADRSASNRRAIGLARDDADGGWRSAVADTPKA